MQVVRLVDEADVRSRIDGKTYEDSLVVGPAIIALLHDVTISESAFDADPTALFIEVAAGRRIVGAIGLSNVTFRRCHFENVGIIGTSESVAALVTGFVDPPDERDRGPGRAVPPVDRS